MGQALKAIALVERLEGVATPEPHEAFITTIKTPMFRPDDPTVDTDIEEPLWKRMR